MQMASEDAKLLSTTYAQSGSKDCTIYLDNSWISKYKYFVLVNDLKFAPPSGSEWIYYTFNTTSRPSGRYYGVVEKSKNEGNVVCMFFAIINGNKLMLPSTANQIGGYTEYEIETNGNYLNIGIYSSTFTNETEIKLYGIK